MTQRKPNTLVATTGARKKGEPPIPVSKPIPDDEIAAMVNSYFAEKQQSYLQDPQFDELRWLVNDRLSLFHPSKAPPAQPADPNRRSSNVVDMREFTGNRNKEIAANGAFIRNLLTTRGATPEGISQIIEQYMPPDLGQPDGMLEKFQYNSGYDRYGNPALPRYAGAMTPAQKHQYVLRMLRESLTGEPQHASTVYNDPRGREY